MRLLTTTLLFFAVGCVGTIGDGQTPGDDDGDGSGSNTPTRGRSTFKSDVHAALGKCSGGGCHDINGVSGTLSRFYNTDADTSYNAILQSPLVVGQFTSIAPILSHIAAGHKGVTYTPDEQTKITGWLSTEATERAGGGSNTPPPPDPKILLREWSGCMSLTNFTTAKMPTAWGALAAGNGQKCTNCHSNGLGVLISADPNLFFNSMSQQSFFMLKFFTVDTAANKVIMNTGSFKNASTMVGHPTFNPTVNAGMTALKDFYDLTMARKTGGTCDPARLTD